MQQLPQSPYTLEQIRAALHMVGGSRKIDFRYELLDVNNNVKGELKTVLRADISHDSLAQIKRTARFTLRESKEINYITDRIKPYIRLWVPPGRVLARYYSFLAHNFPSQFTAISSAPESGGWVEFPMGVFLLSSPTRKDEDGKVTREVEAFDGLVVLLDDRYESVFTVNEGANYYDVITSILQSAGITRHNIERTTKTLPKSTEFKSGTEKLVVVNELLRQINYTPIHVDTNGYYTARQYRPPSERAVEYTYETNEESIVFPGFNEELDIFSVPNKFVVVRTNSDEQPLTAIYTNDNPNSPLSTVNRGRTITDYREVSDIADSDTLVEYTKRIVAEASQIYGKVRFESALNPLHDYSDVLQLNFEEFGVIGKYNETSWSMSLEPGGKMTHEVRKVVEI